LQTERHYELKRVIILASNRPIAIRQHVKCCEAALILWVCPSVRSSVRLSFSLAIRTGSDNKKPRNNQNQTDGQTTYGDVLGA